MPIIAMLCFAAIVAYGPVNLDFWTEMGLIVIGINLIGMLAQIAYNTTRK